MDTSSLLKKNRIELFDLSFQEVNPGSIHLALYFGLGGILARARWGQWDRRVARGAVGSRVHIWCTGRMAPELRARSDSGDC